jgi:hypothetical protein
MQSRITVRKNDFSRAPSRPFRSEGGQLLTDGFRLDPSISARVSHENQLTRLQLLVQYLTEAMCEAMLSFHPALFHLYLDRAARILGKVKNRPWGNVLRSNLCSVLQGCE